MRLLRWIEMSWLSNWVREDSYAYFLLLILHALSMAFLVGGGIAVSLRVLGVAAGTPLARFSGFFPTMWIAATVAVVSGLGLLVGYPAKALTNWVFVVKLVCIIGAALLLRRMSREYFPIAARGEALPQGARTMAAVSMLLWIAGIACGKLLLYTYSMLMTTDLPQAG
jgi:hypothetical protein